MLLLCACQKAAVVDVVTDAHANLPCVTLERYVVQG